jgi:transposase
MYAAATVANGDDIPLPDDPSLSQLPPEPKYERDWGAYNYAQRTQVEQFGVLLKDLCSPLRLPTGKVGRPTVPLSDILFAMIYKVFRTMSARRTDSDILNCVAKQQLSRNIHYNTILKYMLDPTLRPFLARLVQVSSAPMAALEKTVAIDSTGFGTHSYLRWVDVKYGAEHRKATWVKGHVAVGVRTNVVVSMEVGGWHDSVPFESLLKGTQRHFFNIEEIVADKAYSSFDILEMVDELGIAPIIQFKRNAQDSAGGIWAKMLHYFQAHTEEFKDRYHKRSNAESTFSAIKRLFGAHLRSHKNVSLINEAYCKAISYNISRVHFFNGLLKLKPAFWRQGKLG